jgi:hypothetical protein
MTTRIVTDANGRKHITTEPLLHPPQRTWVGLTDEDELDWEEGGNLKDLVKAIEAKLKEKNNV